jgi:amino acid transporter
MAPPQLKRVLSLTDVVLFNVVVIFSVRGMTTAAKMGPVSILLWVLAVGAFFIPLGLTVTELGTRDPGVGGFYRWTRDAVGDLHGFMGAWFYWVSNLTYLPSLLIFLAGAIAFVIGRPALGNDPVFVASLSLTVLWFTAWLNVRGLSAGKLLTNGGALASWTAALVVIIAGVVAVNRVGSATDFSAHTFVAISGGSRTLAYFATLTFALVGLELAPVLGGEIKDPVRTLPRAILISGLVIAVLDIGGTLAVLAALPASEISPISGALGAVQAVADHAGWGIVGAIVAALVAWSVVGGVSAWLGGAARLPLAIGIDHFLPPSMAKLHPRYGTPHVAILFQTVLVSLFIIASQAGSSVAEAYFVLVDLTIILNFIPFLYLFVALPVLRPAGPETDVVRVPGGKGMTWVVGGAGLLATLLSLVTAAIPSPDVGNPLVFEAKLWGGLIAFTAIGYVIYRTFRAAPSEH